MARCSDPQTSHDAAYMARVMASPNRRAVLRALLRAGSNGFTDFALSSATGIQQTSCGKRRGELRDVGFVAAKLDADGNVVTRPAPSGARSIVWCITEAGVRYIREEDANRT